MTLKQRADIYLHHWWNLWLLPAQERIKRMREIIADYEYEDLLSLVSEQMAEAA